MNAANYLNTKTKNKKPGNQNCGISYLSHHLYETGIPEGLRFDLSCSTFIPAPSNALGKIPEDDPRVTVPATHVGKPNEAPGSWLCTGTALAGQLVKDLPLLLSLLFPSKK